MLSIIIIKTLLLSSISLYSTQSSQIKKITFYSPTLGIEKSFNIYLPDGYNDTNNRYPVLYLFRGGEDEWKDRGNIKDIADQLYSAGAIGEMIIVLPGTRFEGNFVGFPVNLLEPGSSDEFSDLGSGKFEDYIIKDLIPFVDENFRTIASRKTRAIDGFSAGAYSSVYLAIQHPDMFCSVGSYDGNFGYLDFDIPHIPGQYDDTVYMNLPLFDPYFGNPRNIEYMRQHNPANIIHEASQDLIMQLKDMNFFILAASQSATSAYKEGTYLPRVKHFVELLSAQGIKNFRDSDNLVLSPSADHNWTSAMEYIKRILPLHWKVLTNNL